MSSKTLIYHPIRYHYLRPEVDYNDLCEDYSDFREELFNKKATQEQVVAEMAAAYYGYPGLTYADLEDVMARQENLWGELERFQKNGSSIFHLRPALVDMFKNTSVADILVDSVNIPFKSFYLYWGEKAGISAPDGKSIIDGAYVQEIGEVFGYIITLTTHILNIDETMKMPLLKRLALDNTRTFALGSDDPVSIGEIFERRFKSIHARESKEEYYKRATALKEAGLYRADYEIEPYEEAIKTFQPDPEDILWHDQDMKAMNLIFNFLCYLSYEKRDVQHRYPKEAPDKLVVKAGNVHKPTEARRAQSKLESLGFRKVYVCGDNVQKKYGSQAQGTLSTSHWRRGHWRNQACGEKLSRHKLIWIEPTLVKPGQTEPVGHVYSVKG